MRAGKLDKWIIIHEPVSTAVDEMGTAAVRFFELARMRAELVTLTTNEFLRDVGSQDETVAVFRIRWLDKLTVQCRIIYQDRTYRIRELVEIGRKRGYEIRVEALGGP